MNRRRFLRASSIAGVAGLAGCAAPTGSQRQQSGDATSPRPDAAGRAPAERAQVAAEPVDVRGALYVPSRAWNTFQMWHDYDESVIERDLGYAERVNINAIRTWVSFEQWHEDEAALERAIDHFLSTADD